MSEQRIEQHHLIPIQFDGVGERPDHCLMTSDVRLPTRALRQSAEFPRRCARPQAASPAPGICLFPGRR